VLRVAVWTGRILRPVREAVKLILKVF